jgi:predicted P-loop ATPase
MEELGKSTVKDRLKERTFTDGATNHDVKEQQEDRKAKAPKSAKAKLELITTALESKYDFYINTITDEVEFFDRNNPEQGLQRLDKKKRNSIKLELAEQDISVSKDYIDELLFSEYSGHYNPILDYFKELPAWDPNKDPNYIEQLCDTVKTSDQERFVKYFTRWLVATIANPFMPERCTNHTCLVLSGGQGYFKSTWFNMLMPRKLARYHYSGKLKLSQAGDSLEVNMFLATCLIINIDDQLKELNKQNENTLKNLITKDIVKYRRLYDNTISEYPRLGSFCASVNGMDFLTDPTGSRRFLPFNCLEPIDIEAAQKINIDLVYSQALYLLKSGFRYWFDQEEIADLHEYSAEFKVHSTEREYINRYFEYTDSKDQWMMSSEIISQIQNLNKYAVNLSKKRLGEAMTELGYQVKVVKIDGKSARVYPVKVRHFEQPAKIDEVITDHENPTKEVNFTEELKKVKTPTAKQGEIFNKNGK